MPSRVTPNEASVHGNQEMSISIAAQPSVNEVSFTVSIPEQENVNQQLLKSIEEVYSPVLKLMTVFGTYFGDTSFKRLAHISAGRCSKNIYISRIYCGVVVAGFWLNFVTAFVGIFIGNDLKLFLTLSVGCLFMAVNGTICLIVLPLTGASKSRFENFLCNVLAISKNVNLEQTKSKSRKGLIAFCFLFIAGAAVIMIGYLRLGISIAAFNPGLRIVSLVFLIIGCGVWLLPIIFFCITCFLLEELFDDLHKIISPLHSISVQVDLAALKMEHHKLCGVIELADKMLSPLLFEVISLYIPILCFSFYQIVNLPQEDRLAQLAGHLSWLLLTASILAVTLLFGSKVSEKIHSFQKVLQTLPVTTVDHGMLLMLILDLQCEPKGLSIGGLVVITKSMSPTVVGVIASYFAVMLTLPS